MPLFAIMNPASSFRILIVDDNMLMRAATKMLLNTNKHFTVVGEAHDGLTGIKMAMELQPDIVLMDINMQPVNGIHATRILLSQLPALTVIGFSALPHLHEEQEIINAGAVGVIHKSATREFIHEKILSLHQKRVSGRSI
jgi:DNA-binding NarL/FixJ family response regulator